MIVVRVLSVERLIMLVKKYCTNDKIKSKNQLNIFFFQINQNVNCYRKKL